MGELRLDGGSFSPSYRASLFATGGRYPPFCDFTIVASVLGNCCPRFNPLFVFRAADEEFVIYDGVTLATRVAKLLPGQTVTIDVIGTFSTPAGHLPTIEDRLP